MSDIFDKTVKIIAEKADMDPATLTPDTVLADLDIQSLELAEIIFDLEDEFDVEIEMNTAQAWEKLKTIGDVVAAVSALVEQEA